MLPGVASPETQRRMRQHDNDVAAIYEIVSGHSEDLGQLREDLTEVREDLSEAREDLTGVKATLVEHGSKLDELLTLLRDKPGRSTLGA
jgi:chromosome segregation ATPase